MRPNMRPCYIPVESEVGADFYDFNPGSFRTLDGLDSPHIGKHPDAP